MRGVKDSFSGAEFNVFAYSPLEEALSLVVVVAIPLLSLGLLLLLRKTLERNKRKAGQLLLGNMLFAILFLSTAFLFLELYFRYFFNSTDSTIATKASRKWFRHNYFTNKSGFRDDIDYGNRIAPGKRRITFLGDSFTAGHGVKLHDRFANLMRDRNPGLEVHAMAVPGWSTRQELEMLRTLSETGYSFDIVVLVFFINDIDCYRPPMAARRVISDTYAGGIMRRTYFGDHLVFRLESLLNPELRNYSEQELANYRNANTISALSSDIARMKGIVSKGGGDLVAVVFPLMQSLDSDCAEMAETHGTIGRIFGENGVQCLDLRKPFMEARRKSDLTLNSFDAHPNETAHLIAAEQISSFISGNIR